MRYRLPEGCVGVSTAGVTLDPDKAGMVEADAAAAADLAPHGILPAEEQAAAGPPPAEAPPKRRGRP